MGRFVVGVFFVVVVFLAGAAFGYGMHTGSPTCPSGWTCTQNPHPHTHPTAHTSKAGARR